MCGIIGMIGSEPITEFILHGMIQLQHRGQDASGLLLIDHQNKMHLRKKKGWVSELLKEKPLPTNTLSGLGHIRYSTSGKGQDSEIQPLTTQNLAIVHNGNLVNYSYLRSVMEQEGILFETDSDSEVILHLLAKHIKEDEPIFDALCNGVLEVFEKVLGAYSIIGIVPGFGCFAFRDPKGIRPLAIGKESSFTAIASESFALHHIGCKEIEDIEPGTLIWIDPKGSLHKKNLSCQTHCHCSFEFNYFAKTPTFLEGKEVFSIRARLGELLAQKIEKLTLPPIDMVIGVPETGNPAAMALAQYLKLPFGEGFVRHQSAGRTFIISENKNRQKTARQKLSPVRSLFQDKTVLLVDDSIVRGTVSKQTINLAFEAGAKKVLFASTFPPVMHPCIYGIDFPNKNQLIAANLSPSRIAEEIGADYVIYNDPEDLKKATGLTDLCLACVTGQYPTSTVGIETLQQLREQAYSCST